MDRKGELGYESEGSEGAGVKALARTFTGIITAKECKGVRVLAVECEGVRVVAIECEGVHERVSYGVRE